MSPPKALFFDIFGTTVDWRTPITKVLTLHANCALQDPQRGQSAALLLREAASALTTEKNSDDYSGYWGPLVKDWGSSYVAFTKTFDPFGPGFVTVDQHFYESLKELLQRQNLNGLFTDDEIRSLSRAWHYLDPWPDSADGLARLNSKFETCTLSNGNINLLEDLLKHGSLPFKHLASAEDFGAYKPSPQVYRGAASKLGLDPKDCALIAAHLVDLKAARRCGFQTIYVERPQEESFTAEQTDQAKAEGWVDMWVNEREGGFLEVARRFGL